MLEKFDEELRYKNRCLRTLTGKLLFGPVGDRLAVDILDRKPGFVGSIDFIHKMNVTELFTVKCNFPMDLEQAEATWYPTYLTMEYEDEDVVLEEKKTIISEDIAVSVMKWTNRSDTSMELSFDSRPEKFISYHESRDCNGNFRYESKSPILRFDLQLDIVASWDYPHNLRIVEPNSSVTILAVATMGNCNQEKLTLLQQKVESLLREKDNPEKLFESLIQKNNQFYEDAPQFLCDDKLINACWKYRWYILKNSMCKPNYGRFTETVMYEGRDHRMNKSALEPAGWEFSKLIPLSTPLSINDLRWHPNHAITKEVIRSAFAGQEEDGLLLCSYVESSAKSYANYMIWAIWLYYLIDPDKDFIFELLPKIKLYISGHEKKYMDEKDSLLIEETHSLTGKEYQPSYWYFHNYPQNPKDKTMYTPLKRVDRSVYHYLNLCGLSNLLNAVGDVLAKVYQQKAEDLKRDINDLMWDNDSNFYYDLHYKTREKAMVQNIVGIYPFWAEMTSEKQEKGILPLMDKESFALGSAFSSVSKECPAFSPAGGWMGNFFKGRNGCVWCGPSWPYTTGIALEALAIESKRRNHSYDQQFDQLFQEYTVQHFRDGNRHKPYLVEHYNSITGERLSDETDYNHSFWIDILVRFVAGVNVEEDYIEIEPIKTHLKWFQLKHLIIRGKTITVQYSDKKERNGIPLGLTVSVDGIVAAKSTEGNKLLIKI